MRGPLLLMSAAPLLLAGADAKAASTATIGTTISLEVPVICKIAHRGEGGPPSDSFSFGDYLEYCNSPGGFLVQVEYQPGSLRGAVMHFGPDKIVLDGSGQTEVMRSTAPRISNVAVSGEGGPSQFRGAGLHLEIIPL